MWFWEMNGSWKFILSFKVTTNLGRFIEREKLDQLKDYMCLDNVCGIKINEIRNNNSIYNDRESSKLLIDNINNEIKDFNHEIL